MDVDVDVDVSMEVVECSIPWAVALTPVLSMISFNSIFADEMMPLAVPEAQPDACVQDDAPWLAELCLENC